MEPARSDALALTWWDFGDGLQLEAGHNGGRWELGRDDGDVEFIERMTRAIVAGRVVEVFGPGRSRVEVTLEDGQRVVEVGHVSLRGCLPMPGWARLGRRVHYAAYEPED